MPAASRSGPSTGTRAGPGRRLILALTLVGAVLVAACAGKTGVADRVEVRGADPYPRVLLVRAVGKEHRETLGTEKPGITDLIQQVGVPLAESVVTRLRRQNVPAARTTSGDGGPDTLLLDLQVTELDRGSSWKRMVVGFGLGRSRLVVLATLRVKDAAPPMLQFEVDAGSGREPGAAAALVGLAAGPALLAAAQGGASAWKANGKGTLADTDEVAGAIQARLDQYFRLAGWVDWTTAPRSMLGTAADRAGASTSGPSPQRP